MLARLPGPIAERNPDRVYTVLFVVAVVVVGTPAHLWPMSVPSALLFPVVVAAGVVLSGRGLLVVYALTLGSSPLDPDSGLAQSRRSSSSSPS